MPKPRGRPRKTPITTTTEEPSTDGEPPRPKGRARNVNPNAPLSRPRGRPRKITNNEAPATSTICSERDTTLDTAPTRGRGIGIGRADTTPAKGRGIGIGRVDTTLARGRDIGIGRADTTPARGRDIGIGRADTTPARGRHRHWKG